MPKGGEGRNSYDKWNAFWNVEISPENTCLTQYNYVLNILESVSICYTVEYKFVPNYECNMKQIKTGIR